MPVFDTYTQGTPNWVELMTPDQRGAAEFYGALFGWQMVENPLDDGHVYIVGNLQGDAVAGITFQLPELEGHPAFWNVYLAADDVDAVAARVGPAGGIVEAEPFDFFDYGRTARIQDPTGARVSLWQPRTDADGPRQRARDPDLERAADPRHRPGLAVLRRRAGADQPGQPGGLGQRAAPYSTFSSGGRPIAGLAAPLEEAPPHWNVYFNVVDVDEAVAQADALGAKLIVPPYDLEGTGRMATLTDPHGALFCLMAELELDSTSGGPERVGGVDAEDLHVGGEEAQLLERAAYGRVVGVAVDLGEELGRGELAADHVALQLGHVDAVGGEAAERLVEGGRAGCGR